MKRLAIYMIILLGFTLTLISYAADFNGDGTGDIAIFRQSAGLWSVRGITRVYFGRTGDNPVPGDYDGTGTDSVTIFRSTSGLWAVRGITRVYFGSSSDEARGGDYNGDGTEDIGIFRTTSGLWAARGVTRVYYGTSGDTAIAPGKAKVQNYLTVSGQNWSVQSGDDGDYQAGLSWNLQTDRLVGADITIDHNTGLMWASNGSNYGCNWGQGTDWQSAIIFCDNLDFAGYTDWRLPNFKELASLLDFGEFTPQAVINPIYFPNTNISGGGYYWSSTTMYVNSSAAYVMDFSNLYGTQGQFKVDSYYLRPVRGGIFQQ